MQLGCWLGVSWLTWADQQPRSGQEVGMQLGCWRWSAQVSHDTPNADLRGRNHLSLLLVRSHWLARTKPRAHAPVDVHAKVAMISAAVAPTRAPRETTCYLEMVDAPTDSLSLLRHANAGLPLGLVTTAIDDLCSSLLFSLAADAVHAEL